MIPFAALMFHDGTDSSRSGVARKRAAAWIAKVAGIDLPLPGSEHVRLAAWSLLGTGSALAALILYRRWRSSAREKELAGVGPGRPVAARPAAALHPTPVTSSPPAASSPPGLVRLCVAVPSERRAALEGRLRTAPSVHALLAETIEREVTSRQGEALVWLELTSGASADEPAPDAEVAMRTLDALVRRDAPSHEGGFRDPASLRSALGPGHAVLVITIVAHDVVLPSHDLDDRARVASAVAGLLPIAPEAVLHHAYRFIPDDASRAFDDATLRATFPELRRL